MYSFARQTAWTYCVCDNVCLCRQVIAFLKGIAGAGKSTLINDVAGRFYEQIDVGNLSNNCERQFGISSFADKLMFVGAEIKGDFRIDQTGRPSPRSHALNVFRMSWTVNGSGWVAGSVGGWDRGKVTCCTRKDKSQGTHSFRLTLRTLLSHLVSSTHCPLQRVLTAARVQRSTCVTLSSLMTEQNACCTALVDLSLSATSCTASELGTAETYTTASRKLLSVTLTSPRSVTKVYCR